MSLFDDSPPHYHPQSSSRQSLFAPPTDSPTAASSTTARIGSPSSLFGGRDDPIFNSSSSSNIPPPIGSDDEHNSGGGADTATATPWEGAISPRGHPHRTPVPHTHTHTHPNHTHIPRLRGGKDVPDVPDVRDLLTAANARIPPAYYAVHAQLVREYSDGADNDGMVEARGAAERVLAEATAAAPLLSPGGDLRGKIWEAVVGSKDLIGRGEVWCLLALVAVVQEGYGSDAGAGGVGGLGVGVDELVEAVDARRHDLPVPRLKTLAPSQTRPMTPTTLDEEDTERQQHGHASPERPALVAERQQRSATPISTAPVRTRHAATALFGSGVDDPWGGNQHFAQSQPQPQPQPQQPQLQPQLQSQSQSQSQPQPPPPPPPAVTEPPQSPTAQQQQSFAADGADGLGVAEHEPDDIHAALRHTSAPRANDWNSPDFGFGGDGGFGGPADGFTSGEHHGLGAPVGSFGGLGGNRLDGGGTANRLDGRSESGSGAAARLDMIRVAMKAPEEHVTVNMLPEKEGMFLFQHRNYQIASARRGSRVVRRYSDFVWLLECLHKRYPFRQLPLLPPKRLAVNGHYLSADAAFLERRRRGLHRFVNALVRHPVLVQEPLVVMFLTVPTELAVWRKQASFTVVDELSSQVATAPSPQLEASLPRDLAETFDTVRSGLRRSADIYVSLCTLVERLERRQEGIAADHARFASALSSLTDASPATYAVDTSDIPQLNDGLAAVAGAVTRSRQLHIDEAQAWDAGVLEDLKRQRDTLVSMRELFDRYDRLSVTSVPALTRRIDVNLRRIELLGANPELAKPGEPQKLHDAVQADREDIERQRVRSVLVRQCLREELVFFQGSQYHVARLHQDWARERVKYAELLADSWRTLATELDAMPTGE